MVEEGEDGLARTRAPRHLGAAREGTHCICVLALTSIPVAAVKDQPWFGWSATSDAAGRMVREWSTDGGSAYTTSGAQAVRSDRYYRYDKAGRLVGVDDITGNPGPDGAVPCVRRGYGFDGNGNRSSQTRATNSGYADTGAVMTTRVFNGADQPVTGANGQGSYAYDLLGRQTCIPAADTANPGRGDMVMGYFDTDAAQSIRQGDVRVTFTLDGAGRRLAQNTTVGPVVVPGAETGQVVRHYTDASDNPAWTVEVRDGVATSTRFGGLTGEGLGITFTTTGGQTTAELALAGLRGAVNAAVKLDGTQPASGIDAWNDWDEYGQPAQPATTTVGGAAGADYGWLGQHERATIDTLGITLMGVRLYNQAVGRFTSTDLIYGGGANWYRYPTDPINEVDLSGSVWVSRGTYFTYVRVCGWWRCYRVRNGRTAWMTIHVSAYEMDLWALGTGGYVGGSIKNIVKSFLRGAGMSVGRAKAIGLGIAGYGYLLWLTKSKMGRYGVDIHLGFHIGIASTYWYWRSSRGPAG